MKPSRLSAEDQGLILTGLHALGLPQDKIDQLTAGISSANHRPAEDLVPGWEPEPPLASDVEFTFGAGDETVTVKLPILGLDYYCSILLPRLEEWVARLYRGQALQLLTKAALNPFPFMLEVFGNLAKRPQADRLKVSFYETAAETFSRPEAPLTARFLAKCPPGQLMAAIKKVVEINRANFREASVELPMSLRYLLTSLRTASMLSIERLSEQASAYIYVMTQEASDALRSNGGLDATGSAGSGASPAAEQTPTFSSEA